MALEGIYFTYGKNKKYIQAGIFLLDSIVGNHFIDLCVDGDDIKMDVAQLCGPNLCLKS